MTTRTPEQPPLPLCLVGNEWRLDDRTRDVGRRGLAEARAALAAATLRAEARRATGAGRRAA